MTLGNLLSSILQHPFCTGCTLASKVPLCLLAMGGAVCMEEGGKHKAEMTEGAPSALKHDLLVTPYCAVGSVYGPCISLDDNGPYTDPMTLPTLHLTAASSIDSGTDLEAWRCAESRQAATLPITDESLLSSWRSELG